MKLICFLSYGYPSIEESMEIAKQYVGAGCDIIEVDFPSSDPYLEGEYIAGRMKKALQICSDYDQYMEGILTIKEQNPSAEIILLSYENTLLQIGIDKFARFCTENDTRSLIYVGSANGDAKRSLIEQGINISCYVRFHLPEDEVQAAMASSGFVYLQAKPTTDNVNPRFPTLKHCINHLRNLGITREIYCGVGIHTPEDIKMAKDAGADGVFVGSTILNLQDEPEEMKQTISEFKQICVES